MTIRFRRNRKNPKKISHKWSAKEKTAAKKKKEKEELEKEVDILAIKYTVDNTENSINRSLNGKHDAVMVDRIIGEFDIENDVRVFKIKIMIRNA